MPIRQRTLRRRDFRTVGAIGGLGLTLGDFFQIQAARAEIKSYDPIEAKAKSVIHIFLPGGMAQQESFDPKPNAPIEYRGDLKTVPTAIHGEVFCETLPQTAKIADKITVIRSMSHGEAAHERGVHNMFTGYRPSPALTFPSIGSVVSHEYGPRNNLPAYVCIPNSPNEFAGTGYLSSSFAPFSLGADPARDKFQVRDLAMPEHVSASRFARRRSALDRINAQFEVADRSDAVAAMNTFYQRAYDLIRSPKAREAFNIDAEPASLRDEYGRNQAGQRMLMARRLVAAGVRFVTLTYGQWDHHAGVSKNMKRFMPEFDRAFAALIRDLDRTGQLNETLVMVSSEFGRTPKVNRDAGRDHWPKVFSTVLAGAGVKRGFIYGASDATAAEPACDAIGPADFMTTVYQQLGIVADKELMAPGNRPIEIVKGGNVCTNLLV